MTPRLLTAHDAAAYLALPVTQFEKLGIGRVCMGTKLRYDRVAIDRHLDALAGLSAPSEAPTADNDDPEAAFARSAPDIGDAARRS